METRLLALGLDSEYNVITLDGLGFDGGPIFDKILDKSGKLKFGPKPPAGSNFYKNWPQSKAILAAMAGLKTPVHQLDQNSKRHSLKL